MTKPSKKRKAEQTPNEECNKRTRTNKEADEPQNNNKEQDKQQTTTSKDDVWTKERVVEVEKSK